MPFAGRGEGHGPPASAAPVSGQVKPTTAWLDECSSSVEKRYLQAIDAFAEGFERAQRHAVRQEEAARREFIDDLRYGPSDLGPLAERAERSRRSAPR